MPHTVLAPNGRWEELIPVLHRLSRLDVGKGDAGEDDQSVEGNSSASSQSKEWETDSGADEEKPEAAEQDSKAARHAHSTSQPTVVPVGAAISKSRADADVRSQHTPPVDDYSRDQLCRLLWAAAIGGRSVSSFEGTQPLPTETRYLTHLADHKQLMMHLATATVRQIDQLVRAANLTITARAAAAAVAAADAGRQGQVAAAQGATSSTNISPPYNPQQQTEMIRLDLSKESLLPALQLLLTFASCARCYNIYATCKPDYLDQFATQMMIMTAGDLSGLVRVLAALCQDLAAALKRQQQQQQPQEDQCSLCTRLLASACLHAARFCIMADRPAQIFWDQVLGQLIQPAVTLAATLQHAYDAAPLGSMPLAGGAASAATAQAAGADAPPASVFDDWLSLWSEDSAVGHEPVALSDNLAHAVCQGYFQYKGPDPVLVKLLASQDMQQLMLVCAAARAQNLWKLAGGKSKLPEVVSSSTTSGSGSIQQKQQQQQGHEPSVLRDVPCWHDQLYTACGFTCGSDFTPVYMLWGVDDPELSVINVLTLMMQLNNLDFWKHQLPHPGTTAGLLQVRDELQRQQPRLQEPLVTFLAEPGLRCGLLLVLLETVLLHPDIKLAVVALKLMSQLAVKGWCLGPGSSAAADQAAPQHSCEGSLMSPVLQQLSSVYLHILGTFKPGSQTDVTPDDVATLEACYAAVVAIVTTADALAARDDLSHVLHADLSTASKALEAAVRAGADINGRMLTVDTQLLTNSIRGYFHEGSKPDAALQDAVYTPTAAAAAGSVELFGLLVSSLKWSAAHMSKGQGPEEGPLELLLVAVNVLDISLTMSGYDKQQDRPASTDMPHRWQKLAGRAFMCCGKAMLSLTANTTGQVPAHRPLESRALSRAVQTISRSVTWTKTSLPLTAGVAGDPDERQELVAVSSRLLVNLSKLPADAGAELTPQQLVTELQGPDAAGVTDQLLEYGEGICALLPVPYCCNNAACRSLKCVSELAAIKAGRCSWCKVAHYCSAKCQKDHWARHKAVCKRLKANTSSIQACKDTA